MKFQDSRKEMMQQNFRYKVENILRLKSMCIRNMHCDFSPLVAVKNYFDPC